MQSRKCTHTHLKNTIQPDRKSKLEFCVFCARLLPSKLHYGQFSQQYEMIVFFFLISVEAASTAVRI